MRNITAAIVGPVAASPGWGYKVREDCVMFHNFIPNTANYKPSWGIKPDGGTDWGNPAPGELAAQPAISAINMGPHTVVLYEDGVEFDRFDAPKHLWGARYPRPLRSVTIKNAPQDLIDQGVLPPYGDPGYLVRDPGYVPCAGPMDSAGIAKNGGIGGGRGDIGFCSEWTIYDLVYAMKHGLALENFKRLFATADGSFALPCSFIDYERTGKPFDVVKWFGATVNTGQGLPIMDRGTQDEYRQDKEHQIEQCLAAFALTDEPRYLDQLGVAANYTFTSGSYYSNFKWKTWGGQDDYFVKDGACIGPIQTRGFAHPMRSIAAAYVLTKRREEQLAALGLTLEDYLHPSSYWKTLLDNQLAFVKKWFMGDPSFTTFRVFTHTAKVAWWQENFKHITLAYLAQHLPEWREVYVWSLGSIIAMTNGKSGSPPAACGYYYFPLGPTLDVVDAPDLGTITPAMVFKTWAEAYNNYAMRQITGIAGDPGGLNQAEDTALRADQWNGMKYIRGVTDYPVNFIATLAYAVYLDRKFSGFISAVYPELEQCYATQWAMGNADLKDATDPTEQGITPRCAFGVVPHPVDPNFIAVKVLPAPAIDTTPTPDPIPDPGQPPGEPSMNFVKGSKHTIKTANPKDADGNADPFVPGDTLSYAVLNADESPATDGGTIEAPAVSDDHLSYSAGFTVPATAGDYLLRTSLANADASPAKISDVAFSVVENDIVTAETTIS